MQHSPKFLQLALEAKAQVKELTVADVQAKQARGEKFHFIDVREESEWQSGHLPRATYMGRGVIERDIEKTISDPSSEIVLYCGGGFRSALVAVNLKKMGYTNVASMDGGFRGWKESGGKIEP